MSFKIKISTEKNYTFVSLWGEIVSEDATKVSKKLTKLSKKDIETIVIDLNGISYIDSYGLGIFVYFWKLFGDLGINFLFLKPDGFMRDLLENSRLTEVFSFIDDLEDL